jgi:hypothetical protein
MSLNEQAVQDWRQVISGKDGQLFVTSSKGVNIFLAEVDTFTIQVNTTNETYQPVGSYQTLHVPITYSVSLTLTEVVVRDDIMVDEFIDHFRDGVAPIFDFQGKLRRLSDNKAERIICRDCIPDGSVDLMSVSPGSIIKRSWTFAVNAPPERLESFTSN